MWINQNFLLQEDVGCDANGNLNLAFMSLRGSGPCHIKMDSTGTVSLLSASIIHEHFDLYTTV